MSESKKVLNDFKFETENLHNLLVLDVISLFLNFKKFVLNLISRNSSLINSVDILVIISFFNIYFTIINFC